MKTEIGKELTYKHLKSVCIILPCCQLQQINLYQGFPTATCRTKCQNEEYNERLNTTISQQSKILEQFINDFVKENG